MAKDRNGHLLDRDGREGEGEEEDEEDEEERKGEYKAPSKRDHGKKGSKRRKEEVTDDDESDSDGSEDDKAHSRDRKVSRSKHKRRRRSSDRKSRRGHGDDDSSSLSHSSDYSDSPTDSESDASDYSSEESESEDERRRRKQKERKKRKEREMEKEKRRRRRKEREKEKDRRGSKRDKDEEKKKKKHKHKKKKKDKRKETGKKGAVTNLWGKYGIIRETDMWNKRPEFTAWLAEVKQVNLETLPNWEEKQMFKQFMEDHNTATFPSKKYYDLDAYHRHKMEKEMKKGSKRFLQTERTVFNDEEQRRQELLRERERQKEQEVEALKRSMQSGMAQDMKEQARLREEMAYQYKIGNSEAAAAIQRRLDPDVAM